MSTLCLLTKELFWLKSYKEAQLYDFKFCWSLAPTEINGSSVESERGKLTWQGLNVWSHHSKVEEHRLIFSVSPNCFFLENFFWWLRPQPLKKKVCCFWLFPSSQFRKIVVFQKTLRVPVPFIDSVPKEQKCPCWGVSSWNGSGHQALWHMSLASILGVAGSEGCGEPQSLPRIYHPQFLLALAMWKSPGPGFLPDFQGKPKTQWFLYHYPTINNIHKFLSFFFLETFCSHIKYLPPGLLLQRWFQVQVNFTIKLES